MRLISMKSLGEIVFKVSQSKYCIYFIKAPLMETLSARCWKVQGEKQAGLAEKYLATEGRQEVRG